MTTLEIQHEHGEYVPGNLRNNHFEIKVLHNPTQIKQRTWWHAHLWYSDRWWVSVSQHPGPQSLVRGRGSHIGALLFRRCGLEIKHQVKAAGNVWIIRQWRRDGRQRAKKLSSHLIYLGKQRYWSAGGTSLKDQRTYGIGRWWKGSCMEELRSLTPADDPSWLSLLKKTELFVVNI